jgi:hypothetical protein
LGRANTALPGARAVVLPSALNYSKPFRSTVRHTVLVSNVQPWLAMKLSTSPIHLCHLPSPVFWAYLDPFRLRDARKGDLLSPRMKGQAFQPARTRCPLIGALRHRPPRRFWGRRKQGAHACPLLCFTLAGLPRLMAPGPMGHGSLDLLRLYPAAVCASCSAHDSVEV